jgi:predicted PolB exonuclease-like 3'-5' exonuclease
MKTVLVFDIETIPDVAGLRKLNDFAPDLTDAQVVDAVIEQRAANGQNAFFPHYLQKVVAISCVIRRTTKDGLPQFKVGSLGHLQSSEKEIVSDFYQLIDKYTPQLVSWNGGGFDLPVLKYSAMKHEIEAGWLYKSGDKWNNYNQKFSLDWHCDLADAFSDFGASARLKMNELCCAFNLPGKIGVDGSQVMEMFDAGRLQEIRNYCETDVINTYLLYLIYQHHNGSLSKENFAKCKNDLREFLEKNSPEKNHFAEYLHNWA